MRHIERDIDINHRPEDIADNEVRGRRCEIIDRSRHVAGRSREGWSVVLTIAILINEHRPVGRPDFARILRAIPISIEEDSPIDEPRRRRKHEPGFQGFRVRPPSQSTT